MCRGQVEGGVAQAIGSALYERLTEVSLADTFDELGPLGPPWPMPSPAPAVHGYVGCR